MGQNFGKVKKQKGSNNSQVIKEYFCTYQDENDSPDQFGSAGWNKGCFFSEFPSGQGH
jgi:hypothetical protein